MRPDRMPLAHPKPWLRRFCIALLLLALAPRDLAAGNANLPSSSSRVATELSGRWKFQFGAAKEAEVPAFDDSSWKEVTLPHTWNVADGENPSAISSRNGVSWYRYHYAAPPGDASRCSFVQFDGANRVAEVFVNGVSVGKHRGGYAGFVFEITPRLHFGADNVIAVKVDNSFDPDVSPLSGDFTVFGGIYRPARILVLDPIHITPLDYGGPGVYLRTNEVSEQSAMLQVTSKVRNDTDAPKRIVVQTRIVDAAGNPVKILTDPQSVGARSDLDVVQETTIDHPHLWNGRVDPYLYRAVVEVQQDGETRDMVSQSLGFRQFRVDKDKGFYLNGQPYDLHGFCMHEQRLGKGNAISDADRAQDMADVVESGATFVRLVHYQHAQSTYRLADENGIVLWTEFGFIDKATDSAAFHDNLMDQLRELIRQNFNHPSVCMWGLQNEISARDLHAADLRDLHELARREDPARPTAEATNQSGSSSVDFVADLQCFNRYYGWYAGRNSQFGAFLDEAYAAGKVRKPIGISEYGAGAGAHQHEDDPTPPEPWGRWHPEEYQNFFHESTWPQLVARPYLWAKAIWLLYDFSAGWRTEGELDGYNDKGLITADHQTRKDAFYYYKAQWNPKPFAYITSRRFAVRTNKQITAKVYSNCDSVEMILNGVSLGTQSGTPDHRFTVAATLVTGTNTLQAIGRKNGQTFTDTVQWQGAPTLAVNVVQPAKELTTLAVPGTLALDASITRDGVPPGVETRCRWTQVGGKVGAIFADPAVYKTTAQFPDVGAYVVRLTVTDGISSKTQDFQVVVGPDAVLKTGLLGYWNFDEASGNTATAAPGSPRPASLPAAGWTPDGKVKGALALDGGTAGVSFASVQEAPQITAAAWIKLAGSIGKEPAYIVDLPGYRLSICQGEDGGGDSIAFDARTSRGNWEWRTEGDVLGGKGWIHIAVVYDRTVNAPPVCYVNGVQRRLKLKNRGWGDFVSNVGTGSIGNSKEPNRGFVGMLDEMRVYNRLLTPGEAAVLAAWSGE